MRDGYWVIRTYVSGPVGEKTKFWVPGAKPPRGARRLKSDIKKAAENEYSAVKTVARLINANFRKGDILLGLDYSDEGLKKLENSIDGWDDLNEEERADAIYSAAERELKLCIRRVKYLAAKEGINIRFIAVTSDMDGKTGEMVRVHHHLLINREVLELFQAKWTLGGVNKRPLKNQKDYTDIAEYLMAQVRRIPDAKKYTSSRNLVRPQPHDRIAVNGSEIKPPKGAIILHRTEYRIGRPQYIRYILPEGTKAKAG